MSLRKMYDKRSSLEYQLNDHKRNSPGDTTKIKRLESEITRMTNKINMERSLYPIRISVGITTIVFILVYLIVKGI